MKPRAILVHGFNVWDNGAGTVDRLEPYLEKAGFNVAQFDYGWIFLLRVRLNNKRYARRLAAMTQPEDVLIGHSNGCNIITEAGWIGAHCRHAVFINPALDSDAPIPPRFGGVDVWHSPSDAPVRLARFLWFHPWGNMGARGYRGKDWRVRNFNKQEDFDVSSAAHSDVFSPALLPYFAPKIVAHIPNAEKKTVD